MLHFNNMFRFFLLFLFAPLAHAGASGCDIFCYDAGVIASHLNGSSGSACNSCQFATHDACCQSECSSTATVSSGWYSSNYVYSGSPPSPPPPSPPAHKLCLYSVGAEEFTRKIKRCMLRKPSHFR